MNDLECPIHLKVRFTDDMLDVRTLWLSDSTICIGVAGGGGLEGLALPLPPCGQLTRCFSAVAELLVYTWHQMAFYVLRYDKETNHIHTHGV